MSAAAEAAATAASSSTAPSTSILKRKQPTAQEIERQSQTFVYNVGIMARVFSFLLRNPKLLPGLLSVHSSWYDTLTNFCEEMWKNMMVCSFFSSNKPIPRNLTCSYYSYMRRAIAKRSNAGDLEEVVQNCAPDFRFKCPLLVSNLTMLDEVRVDKKGGPNPIFHCGVCDQNVFSVSDPKDIGNVAGITGGSDGKPRCIRLTAAAVKTIRDARDEAQLQKLQPNAPMLISNSTAEMINIAVITHEHARPADPASPSTRVQDVDGANKFLRVLNRALCQKSTSSVAEEWADLRVTGAREDALLDAARSTMKALRFHEDEARAVLGSSKDAPEEFCGTYSVDDTFLSCDRLIVRLENAVVIFRVVRCPPGNDLGPTMAIFNELNDRRAAMHDKSSASSNEKADKALQQKIVTLAGQIEKNAQKHPLAAMEGPLRPSSGWQAVVPLTPEAQSLFCFDGALPDSLKKLEAAEKISIEAVSTTTCLPTTYLPSVRNVFCQRLASKAGRALVVPQMLAALQFLDQRCTPEVDPGWMGMIAEPPGGWDGDDDDDGDIFQQGKAGGDDDDGDSDDDVSSEDSD